MHKRKTEIAFVSVIFWSAHAMYSFPDCLCMFGHLTECTLTVRGRKNVVQKNIIVFSQQKFKHTNLPSIIKTGENANAWKIHHIHLQHTNKIIFNYFCKIYMVTCALHTQTQKNYNCYKSIVFFCYNCWLIFIKCL